MRTLTSKIFGNLFLCKTLNFSISPQSELAQSMWGTRLTTPSQYRAVLQHGVEDSYIYLVTKHVLGGEGSNEGNDIPTPHPHIYHKALNSSVRPCAFGATQSNTQPRYASALLKTRLLAKTFKLNGHFYLLLRPLLWLF